MHVTWSLVRTLAVLLFASPAFATDWIVDDDGGSGVDFTDLPAALTAASHADVIHVRPGIYTGFSTSKGVRIIAEPGAAVNLSFIRVENLPASRTFAVSGLAMGTLQLLRCAGEVIVTEMVAPDHLARIFVEDCADVRIARCKLGTVASSALQVIDSTVEVVASTLRGAGAGDDELFPPGDGGPGLELREGAHARVMLCDIQGGRGGGCLGLFGPCSAGNGGPAVLLDGGSALVMTGDGSQLILGGTRGLGPDLQSDGEGGPAIRMLAASTAHVTGVRLHGGNASAATTISGGSTLDLSGPALPALALTGVPAGGQVMTLTAFGTVGANARIFLGQTPIATFGPPSVAEPLLVEVLRALPIGQITGNGTADYSFIIPPNLPPGFLIIAQAELVSFGGQTMRSASVPILLH